MKLLIKFFTFLKALHYFNYDYKLLNRINIPVCEFYNVCQENNIKLIHHDNKRNQLAFIYDNEIKLITDYSVGIIIQIFGYKNYMLPFNLLNKKYIVVDIGMNKGFSSLWFAQYPQVETVIGFEVDKNLKTFINKNIQVNKELGKKITPNFFGLSNKTAIVDLFVLKNDDGVTTMNKDFFNIYWNPKRKKLVKKSKAVVKEASYEILNILNKYRKKKFILKIDVEGAEYEIFDNLANDNLIDKFEMILGETHNGFDKINKHLHGFQIIDLQSYPNKLHTFIAVKKNEYKGYKYNKI